ncbi:MAG: alpha/beta fold hydrolase [Rhodoferax sp.]|uniref:alpha/beta fold hydrolase n=1 Tax=Polynucleobacter hallstattensis TaxID=1855586 RepID=UPI001C0B3894|nr:alpha/beta fold hydrolase [Polynucleobacter hallstattensis]MBU3561786.1 alpha/beta fold hydrolase [Polynucleobacter hallstattensis]MCF8165203.1 alpha/beta fold hydrolase [Rhodoferax sp.]MCF8191173.1 alpha/beta fold hydrolase [Polynucleobacter sp.]
MIKRVPNDWPNSAFSQEIQVGDLFWHVQVSGTSPSHLLLLHGTGSSAHTWGAIFAELSKHYTVVAVDLPGHGFTKNLGNKTLSLDQLADTLTDLRKALKIDYFDSIIGHSAGATLALSYALKNKQPKTIIGLNPSLISLPNFYNKFVAPFLNPIVTSSFFTAVLSDLLPRTSMIDSLLDSTKSVLPPEKKERYKTLFKSADHLNGSMSFMAGADIPSLLSQCKKISSRLTFIVTEDDGWIPIKQLREVIKKDFINPRIIEIKGGHLFHEESEKLALEFIMSALTEEEAKHVHTN